MDPSRTLHQILVIALFLALLGPNTTLAQETSLRVKVVLVQLEARIVDQKGNPVLDLTSTDLTLRVDGQDQDIAELEFVPSSGIGSSRSIQGGATLPTGAQVSRTGVPPLWIYVAAETVIPRERKLVVEALNDLIEATGASDPMVSLSGLPFTDNQELLTAIIDRFSGKQWSKADAGKCASWLADASFSQPRITSTQPGDGWSWDGDAISLETEFAFEDIGLLAERVALYRYLDLIDALSPLPGKKVVVLFRPGLPISKDNFQLLTRLSRKARENRVSFNTFDVRGLLTGVSVEDPRLALHRYQRASRPSALGVKPVLGDDNARMGLFSLAGETGGKGTVLNESSVEQFQALQDEWSNYYLVGFYPRGLQPRKTPHKVRLEVHRPGLKVAEISPYVDLPEPDTEASANAKAFALRRALFSEIHDFLLETHAYFFADDALRPVLVYSAGIPLSELQSSGNRAQNLKLSFLGRLQNLHMTRLPLYFERTVAARIAAQKQRYARGEGPLVNDVSAVPVWPGQYEWKLVAQDEETARLATAQMEVLVPSFRAAPAPSSLMITRKIRVAEGEALAAGSQQALESEVLQVGQYLLSPEPRNQFRRGEMAYLLFRLYGAREEDYATASAVQVSMRRDGKLVTDLEIAGGAFPDRERNQIGFLWSLSTANLAPGDYVAQVSSGSPGDRQPWASHTETFSITTD